MFYSNVPKNSTVAKEFSTVYGIFILGNITSAVSFKEGDDLNSLQRYIPLIDIIVSLLNLCFNSE